MAVLRLVQFKDYLKCLDDARYYDAHEVLEALWFPRRFEKSHEILLIKGFINAAVSFELIKRGRMEASKRAWDNYLKYRIYLDEMGKSSPFYLIMASEVEQLSRRLHV